MSAPRLDIGVIGSRAFSAASGFGGIERAAEQLYPLLAQRGHRVTVYVRGEGEEEQEELRFDGSGSVRRVSVPHVGGRSLGTLSHDVSAMWHALRRERHDVIQLEALTAGLLTPAGRLRRTPVVIRVQGLDWQRAKWGPLASAVLRDSERVGVRWADEVIVVSRELQGYYDRVYGRSTTYIPNGVRGGATRVDGQEHADHVLASFGLTRGKYVVWIGRMVPEKRLDDLVTAFRRVPSSWKLAVVGEGSHTDRYVASVRALAGGDDRIVFTGFQSGAALEALRSSAGAYASPSELEGLPLSVLECMESGVPAILSDIGPHRELMEGVAGYDLFHPAGDVETLVDRLRLVLSAPAGYREVAERAQRRVRAEFSWPSIADRTEALYQEVVGRTRTEGAGGTGSVWTGRAA